MSLSRKRKADLFGSVMPPEGGHEPDMEKIKQATEREGAVIAVFCSACGSAYGIKKDLAEMVLRVENIPRPGGAFEGKFFLANGCTVCSLGPPCDSVLRDIV